MALEIDEVLFPVTIARGYSGGPAFQNLVVPASEDSPFEDVEPYWQVGRWYFELDDPERSQAEIEELLAFFYCRWGRAYGFRFKDWHDFRATDEALSPTGAKTVGLQRVYTSGGVDYLRRIYKPIEAVGITMTRNGSPFTDFAVDWLSGTIVLTPDAVSLLSNVTNGPTPTATTTAAHGLSIGDVVYFTGITGMTELNGLTATVLSTPLTTTFTFNVDTSAFSAYSSGGQVRSYVQPAEDLRWTGQFDVPVRFDTDDAMISQDHARVRSWNGIAIIELLGEPEVEDQLVAPFNLFAEAISATEIDLTWVDINDIEDGYSIERSLDGLTGWTEIDTVAADVEFYADTTVDPETTYYYRVRAFIS